jgi:hypothetical protein
LQKEDIADGDYSAAGPAVIFALERKEFESIVGSATSVMRRGSAGTSSTAAPKEVKQESGWRKSNIKKEELEVIRTLGAGTFGRVKLVRHKVSCNECVRTHRALARA